MKNNKGITLIALVITIIVLLILAGITIAMLTGDNGLLTKANDAKAKDIEASVDERVRLATAALRLEIAKETATDPHYDARKKTFTLKTSLTNDLAGEGWSVVAAPSNTADDSTATSGSYQIVYSGSDYTNAKNDPNAKIKYAIRVNQQGVKISNQVLATEATASNVAIPTAD